LIKGDESSYDKETAKEIHCISRHVYFTMTALSISAGAITTWHLEHLNITDTGISETEYMQKELNNEESNSTH
jgi:hypothetical protein